jgi:hypothetical protein
MRGQRNPHHDLLSKARQFDLFARPSGDGAAEAPEWRTLLEQPHQTPTSLLAPLILEHASGEAPSATRRGTP